MTAVASPPTFPQINRSAWGALDSNGQMNPDEGRGMFVPRKSLPRSNSSSSISSNASNASSATLASNGGQSNGTSISAASDLSQWSANGPASRNRPQPKPQWQAGKSDARANAMSNLQGPLSSGAGPQQMSAQGVGRPTTGEMPGNGQPVLFLLSLNGTFERKTISVPFAPETLRIGRQTNQKTVPTASNGFFDSKVLSRQHAEIFAERNGKVYIRDVKSSNGTFVNGNRLSPENRDSEPHELQTSDHLELGIDIVSEDQKTVVHHKVAAKVEHSGFLNASNNVMDLNFGDLDPANSGMMMPNGPVHMRGRGGSNASMSSRAAPVGPVNGQSGMPHQRPVMMTPIVTDNILKRLANEMRNAKLQASDLHRTNNFINTLLSKDDIKDLEKPDGFELPRPPPPMVNGNAMHLRADAKARFSEPPAPPPQQPLPEKPDASSLKRAPNERSKSGLLTSPARAETASQIHQLTEALNNARRDIDTQSARMRELESMLQKEREARELAEDLAKRLEETAASQADATSECQPEVEEIVDQLGDESTVNKVDEPAPTDPTSEDDRTIGLQGRIDSMEVQMKELRESMESWKSRCEIAEAERDSDRKTLAEMVVQLRAEEERRVAQEQSRSRSRRGRLQRRSDEPSDVAKSTEQPSSVQGINTEAGSTATDNDAAGSPILSRANTITALSTLQEETHATQPLQGTLPYASMVGVVIFGMSLMAYLNGWREQPTSLDR